MNEDFKIIIDLSDFTGKLENVVSGIQNFIKLTNEASKHLEKNFFSLNNINSQIVTQNKNLSTTVSTVKKLKEEISGFDKSINDNIFKNHSSKFKEIASTLISSISYLNKEGFDIFGDENYNRLSVFEDNLKKFALEYEKIVRDIEKEPAIVGGRLNQKFVAMLGDMRSFIARAKTEARDIKFDLKGQIDNKLTKDLQNIFDVSNSIKEEFQKIRDEIEQTFGSKSSAITELYNNKLEELARNLAKNIHISYGSSFTDTVQSLENEIQNVNKEINDTTIEINALQKELDKLSESFVNIDKKASSFKKEEENYKIKAEQYKAILTTFKKMYRDMYEELLADTSEKLKNEFFRKFGDNYKDIVINIDKVVEGDKEVIRLKDLIARKINDERESVSSLAKAYEALLKRIERVAKAELKNYSHLEDSKRIGLEKYIDEYFYATDFENRKVSEDVIKKYFSGRKKIIETIGEYGLKGDEEIKALADIFHKLEIKKGENIGNLNELLNTEYKNANMTYNKLKLMHNKNAEMAKALSALAKKDDSLAKSLSEKSVYYKKNLEKHINLVDTYNDILNKIDALDKKIRTKNVEKTYRSDALNDLMALQKTIKDEEKAEINKLNLSKIKILYDLDFDQAKALDNLNNIKKTLQRTAKTQKITIDASINKTLDNEVTRVNSNIHRLKENINKTLMNINTNMQIFVNNLHRVGFLLFIWTENLKNVYQTLQRIYGVQLNINKDYELQTLALTTFLGGIESAKLRMKELYEITEKVPFSFESVVRASKTLETLTGGNLTNREDFMMILDVISAINKDASSLNQTLEDTAVWFGRLYANIMGGRPLDEAGRRMLELGILTPKLKNEIEDLQKAGVSGDKIWSLFVNSLTKFKGAAELVRSSASALEDQIRDTFNSILRQSSEKLFEEYKTLLQNIFEYLKNNREKIVSFTALTYGSIEALKTLKYIISGFGFVLKAFIDLFGETGVKWSILLVAFKVTAPLLRVLFSSIQSLIGVTFIFSNVLGTLQNKGEGLNRTILSIREGFNNGAGTIKAFKDKMFETSKALSEASINTSTLAGKVEYAKNGFKMYSGALLDVVGGLKGAIKAAGLFMASLAIEAGVFIALNKLYNEYVKLKNIIEENREAYNNFLNTVLKSTARTEEIIKGLESESELNLAVKVDIEEVKRAIEYFNYYSKKAKEETEKAGVFITEAERKKIKAYDNAASYYLKIINDFNGKYRDVTSKSKDFAVEADNDLLKSKQDNIEKIRKLQYDYWEFYVKNVEVNTVKEKKLRRDAYDDLLNYINKTAEKEKIIGKEKELFKNKLLLDYYNTYIDALTKVKDADVKARDAILKEYIETEGNKYDATGSYIEKVKQLIEERKNVEIKNLNETEEAEINTLKKIGASLETINNKKLEYSNKRKEIEKNSQKEISDEIDKQEKFRLALIEKYEQFKNQLRENASIYALSNQKQYNDLLIKNEYDYAKTMLDIKEMLYKETVNKNMAQIEETMKMLGYSKDEINNFVDAYKEAMNLLSPYTQEALETLKTEYQYFFDYIVTLMQGIFSAFFEGLNGGRGADKLKEMFKNILKLTITFLQQYVILAKVKALLDSIINPFGLLSVAGSLAKLATIYALLEAVKGFIDGWKQGGYTGSGRKDEVAGVVHKGEVVFEADIVNNNLRELLILRKLLQSGVRLKDVMAINSNTLSKISENKIFYNTGGYVSGNLMVISKHDLESAIINGFRQANIFVENRIETMNNVNFDFIKMENEVAAKQRLKY